MCYIGWHKVDTNRFDLNNYTFSSESMSWNIYTCIIKMCRLFILCTGSAFSWPSQQLKLNYLHINFMYNALVPLTCYINYQWQKMFYLIISKMFIIGNAWSLYCNVINNSSPQKADIFYQWNSFRTCCHSSVQL